jgi:hypothetical protein
MDNQLDPDAVKLVQRAIAVLKDRRVIHDNCPRCETFDWGVEPIAIEVIPLTKSSTLPMSYYPAHTSLLQFTCKNCGYTMFHNLKTIGL